MNKNVLVLIGIMAALGIVSAGLMYLRAGRASPPADIAAKGLAAVQRSNLTFFGIFVPILVGPIAYFVYHGMLARSPATAQTSYLLLAIGTGVVLTIMAAVVFKMRGFMEFAVLHILYIAGLGWACTRSKSISSGTPACCMISANWASHPLCSANLRN